MFALYTYGHMLLCTSRYVIDLNMINVLEKSQPELLPSPFHEECSMLVFPVKYAKMEVVPVSTRLNSLDVIYDFLSAVWLHEYFTNQAQNCHFKMQNISRWLGLTSELYFRAYPNLLCANVQNTQPSYCAVTKRNTLKLGEADDTFWDCLQFPSLVIQDQLHIRPEFDQFFSLLTSCNANNWLHVIGEQLVKPLHSKSRSRSFCKSFCLPIWPNDLHELQKQPIQSIHVSVGPWT